MKKKTYKPRHEIEAAEPRLLFSAGLEGVLAAQQLDEPAPAGDSTTLEQTMPRPASEIEASAADEQGLELIFVDSDTPEYQTLIEDLQRVPDGSTRYEVVMLDNTTDGISQITDTLGHYTNLSAVHILSHGSDGSIDLGGSQLDAEALAESAELVRTWSNAFSETGDLLIYGCDLAASEEGTSLVNTLSWLTGTDVAASDDLTGSVLLGGDWELEYQTGHVETQIAVSTEVQSSWSGTLATFNVDTTADTNDANPGDGLAEDGSTNTSLRAAIEEANALGGADVINLGTGNFNLSLGALTISSDLTITGAGAGLTVIDAQDLNRVLAITGGTVSISGVTLQNGDAGGGDGGGVHIANNAVVDMTNVVLTGHHASAGGAIWVDGTLTLDKATLDNNNASDGGAIWSRGNVTITDSAISNNTTTSNAGGIWSAGPGVTLDLTNTTISGNITAGNGGGLYNGKDATLINVTITDNSAGLGAGIHETGGGASTTITNTIVAGNGTVGQADLSGNYTSGGNNLIGIDGPSTGLTDGVNGDQVGSAGTPIDPLLGALANNGGPTQTHALQTGSTAIDGGTNTGAPTTDQRGYILTDATMDIGAYQYNAVSPDNDDPVITSNGGSASASINVAENNTAVTTVIATDVDLDTVNYSISSGADAALFNINGTTGELTFISAPNFENPLDADTDNVYEVTVRAADGNGGEDTQAISVTVNNILELVVTNTNATGTGSLHEAILNANVNVGVTDTITFNIGGGGAQTINVDAAGLPLITDSVILDATTQPGYTGTPLITLDGSATPASSGINGITLRANDSMVKGFIVINFADEGIKIDGSTGFGDNNVVQNNWVGIDASGNIAANAEHAVMVSVDATGNQIGGDGLNEGNVIAGAPAGFSGIIIRSNSDNNIVEGNIIGLKPDGITPAGNGGHGIHIQLSSDNNRIGGTAAGAGNIIAANAQDGIYIDGVTDATYTTFPLGTLIQGNSIYSNAGLGIDLGTSGVTANDLNDGDTGANNLQNYPIITSAVVQSGRITISGYINSTSAGNFDLEFFSDSVAGDAGTFLGSISVFSDANGYANFSFVATAGVSAGDFVTATAASATDGTSELAASIAAQGAQNALWISTDGNSAPPGADGLPGGWLEGDVLGFGGPDLNLGTTTDGDFSHVIAFDQFLTGTCDPGALHYVSSNITVGSGADRVDLQIGDVLVSFNQNETVLGAYYETGVDTLVGMNDLLAFRPDTPGDYSSGTFYMLLNGVPDATATPISSLHGISLVEQDTLVGATLLQKGSFLFAEQAGAAPNNIYHFTPTVAGKVAAVGTTITLIDGADIGIDAGNIRGLELVEWSTTVGGVTLNPGNILVTLSADDTTVGTNNLNTSVHDIFVLTVTDAEPDTGTTVATASMLLDGKDVNLDNTPVTERIYAVALTPDNVRAVAQDDRVGLSFDGVDDYVLIGNDPALVMTNTMTMEAWINPDGAGTGSQIILNKEGEYELGITADTGEIKWAFDNTDPDWSWHNTGYFASAGVWTHIAVTYNNGVVNTYANGMLVDSYNGSGPIGDAYIGFNELRIGGRENATTQRFDGQIDEVRIWDTTRSEADIKTAMDGSLVGNEARLAGYWRFDEGTGTTVYDLTANANHGTLGGLDAPAAEPVWSGYVTDEDTVLNIPAGAGVLANDFDDDNDVLTATNLDTGGTLGLVTLNPDGSFSYDPSGQFDYLAPGEYATDTFTYTAHDGTGDSNVATVTITITGLNDAPTHGAGNITAIWEDDTNPPGETVANLFNPTFTDPDAGAALAGVAITSNNAPGTEGVWEYSTDSGTNWYSIGAATDAASVVFDASTRLRFVPAPDFNGNPTVLTSRVLDDTYAGVFTSGTTVETINTTSNGGITPISSTLRNVSSVVLPVNDAPVTDDVSASGNEDATSISITLTGSDLEGTVDNFRLNGLPANGTLYIDAGLTTVAATATDYAATAEALTLYFVPNANWNGVTNFQFVAKDNNGAVDATPGTATLTVNAVNDAPVTTASGVTTNEDTTHTFVTGDFSYTDVEGDALVSVTFNNLNLAGGTLEHSGGTAVTNGMTLTAAQIASLVYTPASDVNGSPLATFDFTVNDADAGVTAAQMDIDVTPVNDAPTTNNVSASGNEDAASIAIILTGGDIDGTVDNYVLNGLPANGTLYLDAGLTTVATTATDYAATAEALTLYFVPNANWNGSTNFQFVAKDNNGLVDATPGTATLTVNAINDAPVATASTVTTNEDTAHTFVTGDFSYTDVEGDALVSVTFNNLNLAGGTLEHSGGTAVTNGMTLTAAQIASLVYTPASDVNGAPLATFDFTVNDADAGVTAAQMDIDVTPVNDAPTTNNVSASGNEDAASIAITLTGGDIDGTVDNYVLNGLPANGTLYLDAGLTTAVATATDYAATAEALTLYFVPNANWNGSTNFQFVAKDNNGAVDATAGTATLTVSAVNDAPTTNNVSASGNEDDTSIAITLTGGDIDGTVDNYVLNGLPANGTLYLDAGLTIVAATATDYAATAEALTLYFVPNANWNGSTNFQFVAKDNNGLVDVTPGTATLTVNSVNDAPTTNNVSASGNEDATSIAITLTGGDIDGTVDNYVLNGLPANGTLYLDAGLTTAVTTATDYAATAEALTLYFMPNANWNGSTNFQFVAKDNNGAVDATPGTATLTVNAVNDAPVATASTVITNEDTAHTFVTGDFSYSDVEGDALVSVTFNNLSLAGGTLEHSGGTAVTNGMTLTAAQIASLVYTPATDVNGAPLATFDFTVNDADAGVTAAQMDIDVTPVNDAPTTNNVSASGNEDATSIAITLTGGDIDGTVDNYVLNGLPANGTLYLDAGLTTAVTTATDYASTAEELTLYFVPNANWNGTTNFQFVAKDNTGVVDATPGTATLTVNAVNDAPVATTSSVITNEDTAHTFVTGDFSYTDVEGDALVSVTFNNLNLAGGTLIHSGGTAVTNGMTLTAAQIASLVYTPASDANGAPLATFDFTVNDADAGVTAAQMDIDVTPVNDAPTTNNVSAIGNEDDASIAITLTGGDIDGTVDNYVLNGLPANGTLYLDAGLTTPVATATDYAATAEALTLYFVPNANWNGSTNFQFVAKDNNGLVDAAPGTATLTANAVNDAPTTNNVSASGNEDDASIAITLTGGDIDGTVDNYVLNGLPANGTLYIDAGLTTVASTATDYAASGETLTLYFVPIANWNGSTNFQFVAKDNNGLVDATPGTATLTVNAVNDAPTTNNVSASGNEDDASIAITLTGGDIDGTVDNYVLNGLPANGTLYLDAGLTTAVTTATDYAATAEVLTLYFVPNANWNGSTNFQFVAKDNNGAIDATPGTATITVNSVNDAPTSNNVSASGNEDDASIAITLTGGDIDGTVDNYVLNGLPANGTLYLDAGLTTAVAAATDYAATAEALTLYFVPNANWNGSTNFQFVAKDNNGLVDATPGTATLTVNAVNDAPTTNDVSASGNEDDASIAITLTGGDIDGTVDNYVLNGLPANGTLYLDAGLTTAVTTATDYAATAEALTLYFVPNTNWNGSTNFQFVAKDNNAAVDATPGTATLTVNAVNDAPTTNNVSASGNEDDASITITLTGGDIDGTVDNYVLNGLPANGTLYLDAGLTTVAATATDYAATAEVLTLYFVPNANWNGSTNFQFVAKDNNGLVDATPGTATLTVNAVNDAPVATASTVITNEDTAHTFVTGDFSYTDVEGDALVSVTFNNLTLAGGTLEHSGGTAVTNGMTLTAAQIASLVYTPASDANGAPLATFDFTVNDADAGVTAAQMDIDVTPVNDAPTTNNVSASGNEDDVSIAITLTGGDIDGTVNNYVLNGLPANGTLYIDAGLTTIATTATDYAATAEALTLYFVPNANWNGSTNFQFVAKDNNGLVDATSGTATLTVNAVNDAPVATANTVTTNEDTTHTFVTGDFGYTDVEGDALVSVTFNNLNLAGGTLEHSGGTAVTNGMTLTAAQIATLVYTPASDANGAPLATFDFTVNDADAGVTAAQMDIDVTPVNDAPTTNNVSASGNEDDASIAITLTGGDIDGTVDNYVLNGLPANGTLYLDAGLTIVAATATDYAATAEALTLYFVPNTNWNGSTNFQFVAKDNNGLVDATPGTATLTVNAVNDAPTTNDISASGNEDDASIAITLTGGDIDGTVDNYVLNGLPANGALYLDAGLTTAVAMATDYAATAEALTLYFVPNANWNGSTNFQFTAKDNNGLIDATPGTATLTVNAVNDAPTTNDVSASGNEDDTSIAISLTGGDIDGTVDNYVLNGLPANGTLYLDAGLTIVATTATDYAATAEALTLYFVPNANWNGSTNFQFVAKDNNGLVDATPGTATLTVNAVNDAPVATANTVTTNEDTIHTFVTGDFSYTDVEGDALVSVTFSNLNLAGGTLEHSGGTAVTNGMTLTAAQIASLVYTPATDANGAPLATFDFTVNDADAGVTAAQMDIDVTPVNDAPTTNNVSASGNEDATSIAITLTGGDIDGTVDNYVLNGLPANGTLYLDAGLTTAVTTATDYAATAEALTLYFVPNANWNGSTNFQFVAKDNNGLVDATPGTATLTINAVNDAPVATASTVITNEDTAHTFVTGDFSYTDVEGDALVSVTFSNLNLAGGTLIHSGGTAVTNGMTLTAAQIATLVFTPANDAFGAPQATFDFTVNDADAGVTAAQMDIDVTPVNDAPTTNNVSASGNEDATSIAITLTGGDIDGTVDNYVLNVLPANGILYTDAGLTTVAVTATDYAATAEALTLYFVPNANWNGSTNFQFVAKDNNGVVDATPGTATLTVNAVNDAPTTNNVSASGNEDDVSIAITLAGVDIDGTVDNYVLNGLPANGTLYLDAGLTTVATTATDYAATAEALTLYFVPNANWNGSTNFQFVAKDNNGLVDATPGTATLTVNAVNDAPTTNNVSASGNEDDASIAITLTGGDIDGTVDNYVLNGLPANGTLYLDAGLTTAVTTATDYAATAETLTLYFVPNANWNGSTNFQFTAKDNNGLVDATPGTATLTVNAVNDVPTTNDVSASGNEDDATIAITLTGGDIDGTVDNYVLNGLPANGTLYLDAGLATAVTAATDYAATADVLTLYFVPNANWNGSTNFQFTAKDNNGAIDATPGTATITVNAVNDAPTGVVTIDYQNPLAGDTITASNTLADADGLSGAISYQWMRNGTAIAGETASTYTTTAADVGTAITVVASYVDDQGTAESVSSSSTSLIEAVSSVEEIPIFPDDPVIDDVEDTEPVIDPKDSDTVAGAAFTPGFQEPGVGEEADVRLMYDVNRYYFKDYDYRDGDVERRMSDHVIKIFDKGADLVMDLSQLVDLVRMQMSETEQGTVNMIFRTVGGITLSLSAGVVTWLTRGGAIAATMVSSVPVLKGFDPIAIMKTRKDKKSDDDNADGMDDSIDSMFEGLDDEQSKITDDQQEIR